MILSNGKVLLKLPMQDVALRLVGFLSRYEIKCESCLVIIYNYAKKLI